MTDVFNPPSLGQQSGWPSQINASLRSLDARLDSRDTPGERLCIYYAIPQNVNLMFDPERAAQLFSRYDLVVFGQPLQDPENVDHAGAAQVIARIGELNPRTRVFGYVSVRVLALAPPAPDPLTDQQIRDQIDAWAAIDGIGGVLLDEFGFDYDVPRTRQNMAIDHVHNAGMVCLINAWVQADAFAPDKAAALAVDPFVVQADHDTFNPDGIPSTIAPGDYSLLETWIIHTSFYPAPARTASIFAIEARARHARTYRDQLGVKWLGSSQVNYGITSDADARGYMELTQAFARLFGADGWACDAHEYSTEPTAGNLAIVKPWAFDRRPQPRGDLAPWIANDFLTLNRQDLQLTLTSEGPDAGTDPGSAWTFTEGV